MSNTERTCLAQDTEKSMKGLRSQIAKVERSKRVGSDTKKECGNALTLLAIFAQNQ